ncbi:hypothetical protein [Rhodoferax antarcticus]|uniref:Uncharacterized protein n=1 Tax=Rhodoferax antarcticus ANT.BR TaxID=1111071 RepID=A0A1Q8Y923_9BURK|nr:hypothetical protein [Rhodoferax antarcticus]OLP04479.1 hypothetical protein BLL52_4111 [Rhodoferax antarcticus ANT.BR]
MNKNRIEGAAKQVRAAAGAGQKPTSHESSEWIARKVGLYEVMVVLL